MAEVRGEFREDRAALARDGVTARFLTDDGRVLEVYALTFGRARLGIGPGVNRGYDDEWRYDSLAAAVVAIVTWDPDRDPEPAGWLRHPVSGRYRPDGDPSREERREAW